MLIRALTDRLDSLLGCGAVIPASHTLYIVGGLLRSTTVAGVEVELDADRAVEIYSQWVALAWVTSGNVLVVGICM